MYHTALLKQILENAEKIRIEFGGEYLCASHIAVAVAEFCRTKYTGFSISDMTYHPARFEEERLRYIFSRESKLESYYRVRLSRNTSEGVVEDKFDMSQCERVASLRGAEALPSDIVFLCALAQLHKSYRLAVRSVSSEDSVLMLLQDTDANIYDYLIGLIADVCSALKKKSDEAAAIRDWRPAAKFAEPEILAEQFFGRIEKTVSGNTLTVKIPKFFGTADLKLSLFQIDGIYYVHDNGCAVRHLSRHFDNKEKCARVLKKICHPCWVSGRKITGYFSNTSNFLLYLQMLIFIAHGDLYYTRVEEPLYSREKGYVFPDANKAEPMDVAALLALLRKSISFSYDENRGLYYWLDTRYGRSAGRASFLMETLDNGLIKLSDKKKEQPEGAIFEGFYWVADDIAPYGKYISKMADRFGGAFDGKDIYLTDKKENFYKAILRFFNLAVLLSEFGQVIDLPKIRRKR